jgi:class 3 adenylate cyclase/TolB-like protein/Tfp pilus assembly protein PilF
MQLERRIAAILAGDMVGYSRLIELDETGTLARHRKHMLELIDPTVERMNGNVVKLTGDGMIVEFGSVVEAVQCAVAIQKEMLAREEDQPKDRRIQYRIAVNLGDVVFEDGDVFGDGVNIAARLEALAEPGGIVVSGTAYDLLKSKVDVGYRALGEKKLKNIATSVRVYQVTDEPTPPAPPAKKKRTGVLASIAAAVLIFAGAAWFYTQFAGTVSVEQATSQGDDTPSIIVMPLENFGGDPAQDYFAAGLSDDITTDLSQLQDLFVIARNTASDYAERGINPREIAGELGVKYVLGGSVRRVGDTLRINVQLIDGLTGSNLWAERYDGSIDDVLSFQDGIVESILASLQLRMDPGKQELLQAAETDNPRAYDAYLQGWEHLLRRTSEGYAAALPHLERAIELDPNYGRAYAALAALFFEVYSTHRHEAVGLTYPYSAFTAAEDYLEKALEKPTALAHQTASFMFRTENQHDEMMREANAAVRVGPNDPNSYFALANALIMNGQPADAVLAIDKAMALDPSYPPAFLSVKGLAFFMMKDYDVALEYLERSYARNPEDPFLPILIATYARLDRIGDAERIVADYPLGLSVNFMSEHFLFRNPEDWDNLSEALLKGGMPE